MIDKNAVTKRCVYILAYLEKIPESQRTQLYSEVQEFLKCLNSLDSSEITRRMRKIENDFRELMLKTSVTAG